MRSKAFFLLALFALVSVVALAYGPDANVTTLAPGATAGPTKTVAPNLAASNDANNPVLVLLQDVVTLTAIAKNSPSNGSTKLPTTTVPVNKNAMVHTSDGLLSSTGVSQVAVWPALVAGASIGMGLAMTFYGYKLFRPSVFLCSFGFGAVVGYMVAERVCVVDSGYYYIVCWCVFAVCGLVCGFLGFYMLGLGIAFVGATGGLVLGFMLTTSFGYKWWPTYPDGILFILVGVFSLTFGIVCYAVEKPFVVPMMALTGAGAAVWGIGYFAGGYASADDLSPYRETNAFGTPGYNIPNSYWGYLSATILLFIIGTFVQFLSTACCENNNLYTWEEHADIEMTERVRYRRYDDRRRYEDYGYGRGVRTRDNYYHRHDHRQGPY
ncbi:Aste57867_9070 [Aphanomyces stellatus]|uniref:Transmembrane protein 198 n=1 Tax=Aphanomyces stellatus TaxID=120398 RepID=A0A485KM48_9STRA|nr:hypothetical protein As57867_009034 [Aphanomyces stellatus]VFT85954.1 Aste57867_9070 [Aphanomyces stellatus]